MNTQDIATATERYLDKRELRDFKLVYHHYYKSLCFFAFDYLKDNCLVEDIVQEVFATIWEQPPLLTKHSKFQGYLYAMVRNRCLNLLRSKNCFKLYQESESGTNDWESDESIRLIKSEVYREIMDSIEKLPERAREVFKLSYLTQLREKEIAERLNISVNSVKTHKQRAKVILKDDLKHIFILLFIFHL